MPPSDPPAAPMSPLAQLRSPQLWAVALALGAITMMWTTYNEYVPQFLTGTFGLSALVVALILTADSAIAFVMEPTMGVLSDRTRSALGKRLPWILLGTPIAVATFAAIPLPVLSLDAALDGSLAAVRQALNPFLLAVVGMLVSMSLFRVPTVALMPELAAPSERTFANGLLQLASGVGTLGALWSGDWLLARFGPAAPFWVASAIMVGAAALLWALVRHRDAAPKAAPPPYQPANRRDIARLVAAVVGWWLGFSFLNLFFGEVAGGRVGFSAEQSELLLRLWIVAFTLAAIPAGLVAERWGRQRSVVGGTLLISGVLALWLAVPLGVAPTALLLVAGGVGWAAVTVSSLPMLLDLGPAGRLGTSTGLYYFAFAAAGLAGPWLARIVRPALGGGALWLAPLVWGAALALVVGIRRDDPRMNANK